MSPLPAGSALLPELPWSLCEPRRGGGTQRSPRLSAPGTAQPPAMEATTSLLDAAAVGDLVMLDPLSEESLLRTLQERFSRGEIYVGTGMRGWGGEWGLGGGKGVGGSRGWVWGLGWGEGWIWVWDGERDGCGVWNGEQR